MIVYAKEDLGGVVPEYMKEVFEIIKVRTKKLKENEKRENIIAIINNIRLNGDYFNALTQLEPFLMKENFEALNIFFQMITNQEGFDDKKTHILYQKIITMLLFNFGDKYKFMSPFKISII